MLCQICTPNLGAAVKKAVLCFDGCLDVRRCPVHLNAPLAQHAWTCGVVETCHREFSSVIAAVSDGCVFSVRP